MRCVWESTATVVEALESRTLLSGSSLSISQIHLSGGGTQLRIEGTPGNDHIRVQQTTEGLAVSNNGSSQFIAGQFQSLVISGGTGNDSIVLDSSVQVNATLYAGRGKDLLQAGSGNDTLVSIGSKAATLIGGSGRDSFWADAVPRQKIVNVSADEIARGDVHRVGSFFSGAGGVGKSAGHGSAATGALRVRRLAEPTTTDGSTYQNFSSHPLFSPAGPSPDDVAQGDVGDCYFLSVLSSVAKIDPWKIRQSVLDMGDGTYLVQFNRAGGKVYVRVDGQLPTLGGGMPDYAGFGAQGSIWVAIIEKAYAVFRGPVSSYASIDGGWMDEAYAALGSPGKDLYGIGSPQELLVLIQHDLLAGLSVTYAVNMPADGAPLLASHAYTVDRVNVDSAGNPLSLRLRNPWGVDGAGNDGNNDGYVTVTAPQAYDSMLGVVSAEV